MARWREWGVPEVTIEAIIRQREWVQEQRRIEERITLPDYAYRMPRLREIEAQRWGFTKIIDTEGYIDVARHIGFDKVTKIDRTVYLYEYVRPRVVLATRSYELTEEIANLMHTEVTLIRRYDRLTQRYIVVYVTTASGARAVMICYLIEPYLVVPDKKARARQVLATYKTNPLIRL